MFLALGLPWVFESIHYFAHDHPLPKDECLSALEIFFRITEFFYFTRGIFFFLIFVCRRKVWSKLKKTFPFNKCFAITNTSLYVAFKRASKKPTKKSEENENDETSTAMSETGDFSQIDD